METNNKELELKFEKGLLKGKATIYPCEGEPYDIDTDDL